MYVTGGQYRSRKIITPKNVKPTLSKVREGVFNSLNSIFIDFSNLEFLDMFAGSGIMGIEAYSRGFNLTSFEKDPKTALIVKQNYKTLGIEADFNIGDSLRLIKKSNRKFDVIYIDPPWDCDYTPILKESSKNVCENGIVIIEFDKKRAKELNLLEGSILKPFKEKVYGRSCVMFLMRK